MSRSRPLAALALALLSGGTAAADTPVPAPVATLIQQMIAKVDAIHDYTLTMAREQRDNDDPGTSLNPLEVIALKHRRTPACLYMHWNKGYREGREVIYCDQRYDGKVQMHEGGLLGLMSLSIDPKGQLGARNPQLKSIGEAGLFRLPVVVADLAAGHSKVPVEFSSRDIAGQASTCVLLHGGAPVTRPFPVGNRELCIDQNSALPDALKLWSPDGRLMESDRFSDIRLEPGLSDADFDTKNPDYHF